MKAFFKQLVLWSLCFLASCTVSMPYRRQVENLLPPASIDCTIDQSLQTPFFAEGNWPSCDWWNVFDAPDLDALIVEALRFNPTIQEVERRIDFARQEAVIARARLFPLLAFDGLIDWEHLSKTGIFRALNPNIPLNVKFIDLTLSFRYDFDFWGKNANLLKSSIGLALANEAEAADVRLITTTALATAYFAFKTNLVRRDLLRELVILRKRIYELQDRLRQSALSSILEPLFDEERVRGAEQLLLDIDSEIAVNMHQINILAGRGPEAPLCLEPILPSLPQALVIPENLSLDLISRRPDLMAQIWRAKAEAYQVGAAIADFFPDINLKSFIGLESIFFHNLFSPSSATWGVLPAIHLPIFTACAIEANVAAHTAKFDEAIFAYNALLLKSAGEVADLLALATAIFAKKNEQQGIVEAATKRLRVVNGRKTSGLDSLFNVYTIQEELIQKRLDDVELLYSQYFATIKLIKALGGGYSAPCGVPLLRECL